MHVHAGGRRKKSKRVLFPDLLPIFFETDGKAGGQGSHEDGGTNLRHPRTHCLAERWAKKDGKVDCGLVLTFSSFFLVDDQDLDPFKGFSQDGCPPFVQVSVGRYARKASSKIKIK